MSKITAEMWATAEATVFHARLHFFDKNKVELYAKADDLYDRYKKGERTEELYNAIMSLQAWTLTNEPKKEQDDIL